MHATSRLNLARLFFLFCAFAAMASAQVTVDVLINFDQSNGDRPAAPLTLGYDGQIYGTTYWGGPNNICEQEFACGTFFSLASTNLYNFCNLNLCADGAFPYGALVQAPNGLLYGTTQGGGHSNPECHMQLGCGTVFSMTTGGVLKTIHAFNRSDGEAPEAGLLLGSNGVLYGTTYGDPTYTKQKLYGSIFAITTAGQFKNLYTFCSLANCTDGANPTGTLIEAPNGNLYGTTLGGGLYGGGTVFELTSAGKLTTLYSFCALANCADGQEPQSPLVLAPNGKLYGTAFNGGPYCSPYACGTVFELTTSGKFTLLHQFCPTQPNCTEGFNPSPLILASDGNLYGTTVHDGQYDLNDGAGTIFKITPAGKLTTLHSFDNSNIKWPWTALLQATDGSFYGTSYTGSNPSTGTVFTFSTGLGPFVKAQPAFGKAGVAIVILGNNLTGATAVTFNGTAATFTVVSDTEITATVPTSATSGTVEVTTPGGTLKGNVPFVVIR